MAALPEFCRVHAIQALVARRSRLTPLDLVARHRGASVVAARHLAMWLARQTTPCSLPELGRCFGDRDHTTVLHALRRVERRMGDDPAYAARAWDLLKIVDSAQSAEMRRAWMGRIAA